MYIRTVAVHLGIPTLVLQQSKMDAWLALQQSFVPWVRKANQTEKASQKDEAKNAMSNITFNLY